jgi:hypothetical protein
MGADREKMRFHGRGGTSFEAPFNWIQQHVGGGHHQPDAMIYMRDGFGGLKRHLYILVSG